MSRARHTSPPGKGGERRSEKRSAPGDCHHPPPSPPSVPKANIPRGPEPAWPNRSSRSGKPPHAQIQPSEKIKKTPCFDLILLTLSISPLSLLDPGHAELVAQTVARIEREESRKVKLIIIDTYARAMAGGDENSGKDTSAVVSTVDAIRAGSKAHVMVIHHCGKDEARGARGHSSLRAATDTEIEITRPDASSPSVVTVKKQRDLPLAEITCFTLARVDLGTDSRGNLITSCVVLHDEGCEVPTRKKGRPRKAPGENLLKLLPQKNTTAWQSAAKNDLGVSKSVFFELLKGIKATGSAVLTENGRWEARIQFQDHLADHKTLINTTFEALSPE